MHKVKAHSDDVYNQEVDKLAKEALNKELIIDDQLLAHNGMICFNDSALDKSHNSWDKMFRRFTMS